MAEGGCKIGSMFDRFFPNKEQENIIKITANFDKRYSWKVSKEAITDGNSAFL